MYVSWLIHYVFLYPNLEFLYKREMYCKFWGFCLGNHRLCFPFSTWTYFGDYIMGINLFHMSFCFVLDFTFWFILNRFKVICTKKSKEHSDISFRCSFLSPSYFSLFFFFQFLRWHLNLYYTKLLTYSKTILALMRIQTAVIINNWRENDHVIYIQWILK